MMFLELFKMKIEWPHSKAKDSNRDDEQIFLPKRNMQELFLSQFVRFFQCFHTNQHITKQRANLEQSFVFIHVITLF